VSSGCRERQGVTECEWLVEGLKESEEMSDEVEVAVRE